MARRKQQKTKHRFICSPDNILIVVNIEPFSMIEIILFSDDKAIRVTRHSIEERIPERKKIHELVKNFCQKFVDQQYHTSDIVSLCAQDLSSVTDILGLRIWKNNRKKEWKSKK